MATKLHLSTFLQEIRYSQIMADRQPGRTGQASSDDWLYWNAEWPVGLQRRRLDVDFVDGPTGANEWPVRLRVLKLLQQTSQSRSRRTRRARASLPSAAESETPSGIKPTPAAGIESPLHGSRHFGRTG